MAENNTNQHQSSTIDGAVDPATLTVGYWRERFKERIAGWPTLADAADTIAKIAPDFTGARGFQRFQSVAASRASLELTAKAVLALDTVLKTDVSQSIPNQ